MQDEKGKTMENDKESSFIERVSKENEELVKMIESCPKPLDELSEEKVADLLSNNDFAYPRAIAELICNTFGTRPVESTPRTVEREAIKSIIEELRGNLQSSNNLHEDCVAMDKSIDAILSEIRGNGKD